MIILFTAGLFAAGRFLAACILPRADRAERLILSFPLGAALYTLLLFIINQVFGLVLTRALLAALLAAVLAASAALARAAVRRRRRPAVPPASERSTGLSGLARIELALLLLLLLVLACVGTFVPVDHWDVNSQYFPIAREIFLRGTLPPEVSPAAAEVINAFPPGYTLLVASGYIIHGGLNHFWARLLSPLYGILLLMLLYRMGRRHLRLSAEAALGGLLLCASISFFADFFTVPTSTICFCFYALAALYFLLDYAGTRSRSALAAGAVFLGFSYWTSYTGIVLVACVVFSLVIFSAAGRLARRNGARAPLIPAVDFAVLLVIVGAIALPHLARNFLLFGNPIYPAMYQWIGGAWITDWSREHLLPRVVPARSFYLRPRWEIFHGGFLVSLLFFLSLCSGAWHRGRKSLALGIFCLAYLLFYLLFLTWPRTSGISIKLLLPMLIPASLFAGERLNRILRGRLPLWQGVVILVLVPIWSAVMLRDEVIFLAVRGHINPGRFPDFVYLARALLADLDEILIWICMALCLAASALPARRGPGLLLSAFLLLAVVCRPAAEGAMHFSRHVTAYSRLGGYSFWNAARFPGYLPEAEWLDINLPSAAVIATYDNRTYIYPRRVVPLDTPRLWPMYRGLEFDGCIALLRENGVTHLCLADYLSVLHPLAGKSPIFDRLGDPSCLPLLHRGPGWQEAGHELKVYAVKEPKRSP